MCEAFVDSKIQTKFGIFFIRVYAADQGKETVVLWTEKLHRELPVLVRPHSECFTGDLLGSLQCDCGKQLQKALELIQEEGGVFIYLRQEGRGIGLFEKIKAYNLQFEGRDTFEANILLGHSPDERSYEMVKVVLDELKISRVRLLTNNPNKVSEIAKHGIEVVEQVPLVVKPNKYNKGYLLTKREKFDHFLDKNISPYFYQFHVNTLQQVQMIGDFCKDKKRDPLLKFFVGISANLSTLGNKAEINRIKAIFQTCGLFDDFVPVLHFSFRDSKNVVFDLQKIKEVMPFVKYLQTNDFPTKEIKFFEMACELFSACIPFCDENFDLVHTKTFRNLLKNHQAFLLLDNSKGTGVQESKSSLMKKIDVLLNYGLNNLGIFGGFGPDALDTYFDLRRYYKLNFSIDAETKTKTDGIFDVEKIKLYLFQLIRFDDPKFNEIEQTKTFLKQHCHTEWDTVVFENQEFFIHPKVFHAGFFPSTLWFAEQIKELVKDHFDFCEVGSGSGIISCLVAIHNPKIHIVATDLNPFASENTKLNVTRLDLEDRIQVTHGDVFDGIPHHRFDSIFWSLPFGYLDPGIALDLEEMQVFDSGYRAIRKFFQTAKDFLKPRGKLLVGFSSDLGNPDLLQEIAKAYNLKLRKINEKQMSEKEQVKFELLVGFYE